MSKPTFVTLLSWNIDGLSDQRTGERTENLCVEMLLGGTLLEVTRGKVQGPMPDVIVMQEVVRHAHLGYLKPHFQAAGFRLWPEVPLQQSYYEAIAVRPPWTLVTCERVHFHDSPLARAMTIAKLQHAKEATEIHVITAHMESLPSGSLSRRAQCAEVAEKLHALPNAIFLGDTNMRDHEWALLRAQLEEKETPILDVWGELGEDPKHRWTWAQPVATPSPEAYKNRAQARYDRAWIRDSVTPVSFKTRSGKRNSDHHGIEVQIRIG